VIAGSNGTANYRKATKSKRFLYRCQECNDQNGLQKGMMRARMLLNKFCKW
jgi:hypothetical protein